MYQRDIPKLPIRISRSHFVDEIFYLGIHYQHGYDTIVASVQLGDFFVNYSQPRSFCYRPSTKDYYVWKDKLLATPCPQFYSIELAHVVTVIIAKFNEDYGYINTTNAIINTENRYIVKLEWEICNLIQYHVKIDNFITVMSNYMNLSNRKFNSFFLDFSKYICLDPKLLSTNPYILIYCSVYLYQKGKLVPYFIHKENVFINTMTTIIQECDLDPDAFIKEYKALALPGG
jgi:hypothetical protein